MLNIRSYTQLLLKEVTILCQNPKIDGGTEFQLGIQGRIISVEEKEAELERGEGKGCCLYFFSFTQHVERRVENGFNFLSKTR